MTTIQNYYSQTHTVYEIKGEGVYEEIRSNRQMFNFSNYPTESKYYDNSNQLLEKSKMKQSCCD